MTRNAFIVLMLAAVAAIFIGATVAERYTDEGIGRTLMVGAIAAAIIFPISMLLEKMGWIKGRFEPFKRPEPLDGESHAARDGEKQ